MQCAINLMRPGWRFQHCLAIPALCAAASEEVVLFPFCMLKQQSCMLIMGTPAQEGEASCVVQQCNACCFPWSRSLLLGVLIVRGC